MRKKTNSKVYTTHWNTWKDCKLCELCKTRTKVVLYKGPPQCDILLIGEAPGAVEDILGVPFVGPSGQILGECTTDVLQSRYEPKEYPKLGYTNVVACIPRDPLTRIVGTPTHEQIESCWPRLEQLIEFAAPSVFVLVGRVATELLLIEKFKTMSKGRTVEMIHPASVLRNDVSQQVLWAKMWHGMARVLELYEEIKCGSTR
jgi:DNA polymerase